MGWSVKTSAALGLRCAECSSFEPFDSIHRYGFPCTVTFINVYNVPPAYYRKLFRLFAVPNTLPTVHTDLYIYNYNS